MEETLERLGFEVILETNRNLKRLRRALEDFREDGAGADVALVFYAGHGVEIGGENRLLPTDTDPSSLQRLNETSLPLDELRDAVASLDTIRLVILDACRNDPFDVASENGRGAKAIAAAVATEVRPGLGRMGRSENMLFAFAAAPGETASDGTNGHSPFSAALTKYLITDGLDMRSVLTLVQQEVYDRSRGRQLPYVESGLPRFFFAATSREALPERERLLLAMAEVTPSIRAEVEQVAVAHKIPFAPLYAALIAADGAGLSREKRTTKLAEAAAAFVSVRDEMQRLSSDDPAVTRLRLDAEEQLALGAFAAARAKLGRLRRSVRLRGRR